MRNLQSLIAFTLALTLTCSSIYGQDSLYQGEESYGAAYAEGSNVTHWSVYIPVALLVGAAIWFGVVDGHQDEVSSNSQDALGSIDNSKRNSHYRHSYRSSSRSQGSYCHSSYK